VRLAPWILLLSVCLGDMAARAQYLAKNPIKHVVVIVQENRTPDNLFQGLCNFGAGCGPRANQYNISSTYVNANRKRQPLQPIGLATPFDLDHSYGGPNLNGTIGQSNLFLNRKSGNEFHGASRPAERIRENPWLACAASC
jgi:phospholipase C